MHGTIGGHSSSVDGEGSHHADHVSPEECLQTSLLVLVSEAAEHVWVFEVAKGVRLHQSLDIIEGVVENPVKSSTHSTSDQRHVNRDMASCIGRSQVLGNALD